MSDVDIVIDVATTNVKNVYNLSNALQGLNRVVAGATNPMKNLDARSRALSRAIGSSEGSLRAHAKTVSEVTKNNAILTSELSRVRNEIKGLGASYKYATGTSAEWRAQSLKDLKAYEAGLKQVRIRALTEDLKSLSQEQKRLGKDAQFVGRSLIIGLTTPIMMFSRYALQSLVSVDKEFVRLNKVLESVAPNLEMAAKKMGIDLGQATDKQNERLQEMVANYQKLEKALTDVSIKFGLSKNIAVGLAGEFAELGIQSTTAIAKITELTAATEKLGDMDIGAAKDLVQSLYFQAVRAMQQSGESRNLDAFERESRAIAAATAQLNLFNAVENTTALTLRDLGDAFPEVAAAATSFGLSMTEAAGLLAPMKAAGFEIGASANSIKVSLQRVTAPTKQNKELFDDLTKTYKMNFNLVQGTGVDAIQSLIDAYNTLNKSSAGQEGIMEFFAKVFGVRQGPRMEVAIAQAAEFDRTLKDASINTERAEKRIQQFANEIIDSSNRANKGTIPLINSYKDIAIVARIATAAIDPAKGFAVVEGYGAVTQKQIDEARKVRDQIGKRLLRESQQTGEDLIGQVGTETGRAMIVQLAGAASAAEVAQRELGTALTSLDVQIKIMRNSFKMMATEVLKQVTPAIKKLSEFAVKLYEAFMRLNPAQRDLIAKLVLGFTAAAAAVGPLVFIFGQFRLAIGTAGKVLFGFLPGLKTLSVETLAAKSGMLKLRNGLISVGDTVYNNNTRFATFIATLASGEGPVAKLATKFGLLTGALKETTTAQTALTTEVYARQAERSILPSTTTRAGGRRITTFFPRSPRIGTIDPITGAPAEGVRAIRSLGRGRFEDIADATRRVTTAQAGAYLEEEASMFARGDLTGTPGSGRFFQRRPVVGRVGATGVRRFIPRRFVATRAIGRDIVGEAVATRLNAFEAAGITRRVSPSAVGGAALIRGGREISEDKALRIAGGGVRGRAVGAIDTLQTKVGAAAGKVTSAPSAAMGAYTNATNAAKKAVQDLTTQNLAFGKGAPGIMARAKVSVLGFAKSFSFVTKAMNLMKVAFIGTGIGLALLAVAGIVYMVAKNFDEFKKKIAPAMESFKAAFNAIKEGAMALIQPFIDLFSQISGGSGDSANQISFIGAAVNVVAEVVEFLAKVVKVTFQVIGKVIRFFLGNWVSVFRGIIDIVKGFKKILSGDILGGLKQVFGGVIKTVYGLLGPFRFVFDWILKGLILLAKGASKALGWIPGLGGKVKSAVKGLENLQGFFKGATNIKATVKVEGKGEIKKGDVDTDEAQEKIANATGSGIKEGAAEGAKELAKTLASRLKNLKKELQEEIVNRVKGAMDDVVASMTDSLKNQKEAALKIYDDQIEAINDLKRKEEELTKTKEYENRKREIEQKRALNALNSQRAYELAIYEGRIDDAREISFERQKNETESNKELEDLNISREKDLKEAARANLIDSINDAKKAASDYFDEMIKKFTESAKKITEFPPTTAQEFQTQLEQLGTAAKEAANNIGTNFSSSFTGLLGNLGVDSQGPLTTALEGIGKILTDNNPFGKDGVWQKSIDGAIDYLTKKYDGLYNTLTTVVDTKSSQFKKLFDTYNKYQTLVDAESGAGGGGGAGGGDGKGSGQGGAGTAAQPGYYYRSKERGQKSWSSWVGPRDIKEINAIKPILSKTGLFEFKFANYNPSLVNVGGGGNATSTINATIRAVGGAIPFAQGGPTNGPIQQGIPAILHGGEYVVRNSAVKKYGWGMMQQINQGTYKPKLFANGGMIDRRMVRTDPSMKEWMWQQSQGGLTESYWDKVGSWETGGGKSPNLRHKNKKFAGGYGLTKENWLDYGGTEFAESADKATKIQQLVIANRKAVFGFINQINPNPGMPAGAVQLMYPTGTGGWTTVGKTGKVNEPFDVKNAFASEQSRKMYLDKRSKNYFRGTGQKGSLNYRAPHERAIQLFGYNPLVVPRSSSIANQEFLPLNELGNLISRGQYPSLAIGGIVDESRNVRGGNVGLKNIKSKSKKKGGVFGFLNKIQSGIEKGLGTTADFMDYTYQQLLGIPLESLQASTLNPLAKALNIPGSENLRVAGKTEAGLNAAFLALDVATAKMATGPITALKMAMLGTASSTTGGRIGAKGLQSAFEKQAFIKAMDLTPLGRPIATTRVAPYVAKKEPFITEMGSNILSNVEASRLAREARNMPFSGFAPEYLPVPKGGFRRPSLGGGWKGFVEMERIQQAAASATRRATSGPRSVGAAVNPDLIRQTVLENIAISRQARQATQVTKKFYVSAYREMAGEEARRQAMLPFGENLRSVRRMIESGRVYGGSGENNPLFYRTNRPRPEEQNYYGGGNYAVLGGGFKRFIEETESQLANDIIETNRKIRIQSQIRRNVEGNIATNRQARIARRIAQSSGEARSLGITDETLVALLSDGFTFEDLSALPKSIIKRVSQPASKVIKIRKDQAPRYTVEALRKIPLSTRLDNLPSGGLGGYDLDEAIRDFAHVSATITGYVRGDTFDVSGMYSAAGHGADISDVVATLYREILLPNNITKIENTNTLSEHAARMLNNIKEYLNFFNPNMQVVGNTTQGNYTNLLRPGDLQDAIRVGYMGFSSPDEMIASIARGDIVMSNEYTLFGTPAERLKNMLFVQQLSQAKRSASMARRGITPKFTGGLISSFGKGGIVDESRRVRGGNIGLKNIQQKKKKDDYGVQNVMDIPRLTNKDFVIDGGGNLEEWYHQYNTWKKFGLIVDDRLSDKISSAKRDSIYSTVKDFGKYLDIPIKIKRYKNDEERWADPDYSTINYIDLTNKMLNPLKVGQYDHYNNELSINSLQLLGRTAIENFGKTTPAGYSLNKIGKNLMTRLSSPFMPSIIRNMTSQISFTDTAFKNFILHELGHAAGLGHPFNFQDGSNKDIYGKKRKRQTRAIMSYTWPSEKYGFGPGDIAGLQTIISGFPVVPRDYADNEIESVYPGASRGLATKRFIGGLIPSFANGGAVPKFDSMAVPAILHGGEYVVNSKAVKNIGFATLQAMNNMRFQKPSNPSYSGPVSGQASSTSQVHIYVDNFIGQKDWFESMMKDYNVNVVPQNQKAAGLENRTVRTYSGINRGM